MTVKLKSIHINNSIMCRASLRSLWVYIFSNVPDYCIELFCFLVMATRCCDFHKTDLRLNLKKNLNHLSTDNIWGNSRRLLISKFCQTLENLKHFLRHWRYLSSKYRRRKCGRFWSRVFHKLEIIAGTEIWLFKAAIIPTLISVSGTNTIDERNPKFKNNRQ